MPTIEVSSDGGTALATVPTLNAESVARPAASSATPDADSKPSAPKGRTRRTIGLVTGGVGIVGLGVSAIVGLGAKSKLSDADAFAGTYATASGFSSIIISHGAAAQDASLYPTRGTMMIWVRSWTP